MKKLKFENAEGQHSQRITKSADNESFSLKKKKKKRNNKFKVQDSEISTTTAIKEEEIKVEKYEDADVNLNFRTLWINYKPRSTTLIRAGGNWYEQLINENVEGAVVDAGTKKSLKIVAQKILKQDVDNYNRVEERGAKKEDVQFRKTVYSHGTFRDKLAAHVLRCMESPVHSLSHLNTMILMISPKTKNEYEEALDSLFELFSSTLLPDKRVARKFETHKFSCLLPLLPSNREQVEKQLALWYFEDQLQFAYRNLISQLTQVSSDTVDKIKMNGIKALAKLVKNHPGQDAELVLESIVNKLGDPSRKVAAQTMHSLQNLMETCFQLKGSVVTLVEILLYRPNISAKTQYYCLCYLKDLIFKRSDFKLAAKLIKLYIGFFKACTKKGEVDTRLMGALLRGMNRAFPYSRLQGDALNEQINTLYKLCHVVNFNISTQALQLIYQVVTGKDQVEDRFYQSMYGQIQDPAFGTSSGNAAFLNLVFKAMMRDDSVERRQAFIKRLLQVAQYQSPHLMCGILFLVSEIIREKPEMKLAIQDVLRSNVECEDTGDDFETFEDVKEEDDEAFEDVKEEDDEAEDNGNEELEDSKEDLGDILDDDTLCVKPEINIAVPAVSSWFHQSNTNSATTIKRNYYDPYIRNPQYCGAHFSPLWEMIFLQGHYHPSVSVFANKIVDGGVIDYSGDPMQDFTLIRFLDRFVYKNPKKETDRKESEAATVLGSRANYCPEGARGVAVNTQEFIKLESDQVPEDQQFFHSYFTKFSDVKKKEKDDDEDSVNDEDFDDYLSKLGGAASDESDVDEALDFAAGASGTHKGGEELMEMDEDDNISGDEEPIDGEQSDDSGDEDKIGDSGDDEFDDEGDDLDFDEENVAFSDDDDDFDSLSPVKKSGKLSMKQPQKKKKGKESLDSMFASADDFAHLLEDHADEDRPTTTSKALSNKDRAHSKQLNWEVDRNDKIKERGRYGNRGKRNTRGQNKGFKKSIGQRNFKSSAGGRKQNFNKSKGSFKAKRGRRK